MEDVKILKRALKYMQSMGAGVDPITGEIAADDSVISNVKVQKCCEYVAQVLEKLIDNNGVIYKPETKKPFAISDLQKEKIIISDRSIGVSDLANRINAVLADDVKKITGAQIADWLVDEGYLSLEIINGKSIKKINSKSKDLGISAVRSVPTSKQQLFYNKEAQKFIINNIETIALRVHKPLLSTKSFFMDDETKSKIEYSEEPTGIMDLTKRINEVVDDKSCKVRYNDILSWLLAHKYISLTENNKKTVNETSSSIGITLIHRKRDDGEEYDQLLYDIKAQKFIVHNINEIMNTKIMTTERT